MHLTQSSEINPHRTRWERPWAVGGHSGNGPSVALRLGSMRVVWNAPTIASKTRSP